MKYSSFQTDSRLQVLVNLRLLLTILPAFGQDLVLVSELEFVHI